MSLNLGKKPEVEEYSPGLFDRLVSRGAKYCPSLTGTTKIRISEEVDGEEREGLIRHELMHHKLRYYIPIWMVLMFLVSFLGFSYFVWCFFLGWFLWEGLAVMGEKGWI